ncbi:MAG TPA: hypothetical protein VHZ07_03140 [Bryobacteraceae bacterium]|jgi:hypothetical protein|nr:hypothetical protein [Bryobacteraceae bacterium]
MSVTKSVEIGRPAAESYDFIADPGSMPRWAIHNVKTIRKMESGRWEMDTPRGRATLVPAEAFEAGMRQMDGRTRCFESVYRRSSPMSSAIDNLQAALQRAMAGRPTVGGFPYLAETLRSAGVTRNLWFLPACLSLYLTEQGPVVTQGVPLVNGTVDVPPFDREAL